MKKVNLGCGANLLPGYANVDVQDIEGAIRADMRDLPFERSSLNLIYVSHVLEHLGRHEWWDVLKYWHNLLVPSGTIRIAVPDFDAIVQEYVEHQNLHQLLGLLYGGQRNRYDYHQVVFSYEMLEAGLIEAGFVEVRRYEWRQTDAAGVDDYSKAYLPHLDQAGRLMSLNVEATKP